MLYPRTFIHPSSQFQYISLIQILGHIFNPRSGACFSSQLWYICFITFINFVFEPMLDPHLQHGACYTQSCLWFWSQLARGMPLNPLIHMFNPCSCTSSQFLYTSLIQILGHIFNPSSGAHFSSQFWYTCFIWIINFVFSTYVRPASTAWHWLCSAMPPVLVTACWGNAC